MVASHGSFCGIASEYEIQDWRGRSYFADFIWIMGNLRYVFEVMDYGSHGTDRSKYRMDLNRALFLQSQECHVISIPLDEMKENPLFVRTMIRCILAPYLVATDEKNRMPRREYQKIERQLMRLAIRHNRIISPAKAAIELEVHKQTVIKYCRSLVERGKFRVIPTGSAGKIYKYEYIGSLQSPDLL